ncbi:hypothetical protein GEMRC1_012247 [Eukaryota sp. GEM-RC1]
MFLNFTKGSIEQQKIAILNFDGDQLDYDYDADVLSQLINVIGCLNRCRFILYLAERLRISPSLLFEQIAILQQKLTFVTNVQPGSVIDLQHISYDIGGLKPFSIDQYVDTFKFCNNVECPNCVKCDVLTELIEYMRTYSASGKYYFSETEPLSHVENSSVELQTDTTDLQPLFVQQPPIPQPALANVLLSSTPFDPLNFTAVSTQSCASEIKNAVITRCGLYLIVLTASQEVLIWTVGDDCLWNRIDLPNFDYSSIAVQGTIPTHPSSMWVFLPIKNQCSVIVLNFATRIFSTEIFLLLKLE